MFYNSAHGPVQQVYQTTRPCTWPGLDHLSKYRTTLTKAVRSASLMTGSCHTSALWNRLASFIFLSKSSFRLVSFNKTCQSHLDFWTRRIVFNKKNALKTYCLNNQFCYMSLLSWDLLKLENLHSKSILLKNYFRDNFFFLRNFI